MKKSIALAGLLATSALALSGCSGTGGGTGGAPAAAPGDDEKVTVTVWSAFSDRELAALDGILATFHEQHPNITIKNVGSQTDDKITQAIRGGKSPDVAISFSSNAVGQFCSSGTFQDLTDYIDRDKVDLTKIPQATLDYTQYDGVRCTMPLLADVYGLYYNKKMFADAGITAPPKTMSEFTEDIKKLTQFNADGSIKVAGYVPTPGYYANAIEMLAPQWGATWQTKDGQSNLAADPAWTEMFEWQKEITDFYGLDNITRFTAEAGQQYSAEQDFQTGRIAMAFDGEYRTAFIKDGAPDLDYATAPMPVADDHPELYGTGYTTGTVIGMPKGAQNAGAAWEVIKYLTTDTDALVTLANALGNVPTSTDALKSPDLKLPEQFQTFLDMFDSGKVQTNPATKNGNAYTKIAQDFETAFVGGSKTDLAAGLKDVDQQIDDANALGQ
jgi:multiple sugar transport system substrate-binding protein